MGRQVERNSGLGIACEQFVQVFSQKHRQVPIGERLSSQPPTGPIVPDHPANGRRTNIEIDDELIREALRLSGLKTKRAAVEAGLKALIPLNRQKKILDLAGKVH